MLQGGVQEADALQLVVEELKIEQWGNWGERKRGIGAVGAEPGRSTRLVFERGGGQGRRLV